MFSMFVFNYNTNELILLLFYIANKHMGLFDGQATAEEKFKHCSAAYKTLCDSFAAA